MIDIATGFSGQDLSVNEATDTDDELLVELECANCGSTVMAYLTPGGVDQLHAHLGEIIAARSKGGA